MGEGWPAINEAETNGLLLLRECTPQETSWREGEVSRTLTGGDSERCREMAPVAGSTTARHDC